MNGLMDDYVASDACVCVYAFTYRTIHMPMSEYVVGVKTQSNEEKGRTRNKTELFIHCMHTERLNA